MKVRMDYVTNSSCACFIVYTSHSRELTMALKKFVFTPNYMDNEVEGWDSAFLELDEDGISIEHENDDFRPTCNYLLENGVVTPCPYGNKAESSFWEMVKHFNFYDYFNDEYDSYSNDPYYQRDSQQRGYNVANIRERPIYVVYDVNGNLLDMFYKKEFEAFAKVTTIKYTFKCTTLNAIVNTAEKDANVYMDCGRN